MSEVPGLEALSRSTALLSAGVRGKGGSAFPGRSGCVRQQPNQAWQDGCTAFTLERISYHSNRKSLPLGGFKLELLI